MQEIMSFGKKVSFCVLPVDDFTKDIYRGYIQLYIDDILCKPIRKTNGLYVFTGISNKIVKLNAIAKSYKVFECTIDIDALNPLNPIIHARLKPDSDYKFPSNACGVRFSALNRNNKPVSDKIIYSYINDMSSFEALLDEDIDKKQDSVKIYNVYGNDIEYTSFKVVSDKENEGNEYIYLGKQLEDGRYEILNKLNYKHFKKDILLNSYITDSNQSGDVLVVFNKLYKASSKLTVEIEINNTFKEVSFELKENSIVNMGNVIFK